MGPQTRPSGTMSGLAPTRPTISRLGAARVSKQCRAIKPQQNHAHRKGVPIQPLEPMLLPKLRICLADFPWSHCSIDQSLFSSESGCGSRNGQSMREATSCGVPNASARHKYTTSVEELWISGRAFVRIVKAPRTAQIGRAAFSMCSDAFLHLK